MTISKNCITRKKLETQFVVSDVFDASIGSMKNYLFSPVTLGEKYNYPKRITGIDM